MKEVCLLQNINVIFLFTMKIMLISEMRLQEKNN